MKNASDIVAYLMQEGFENGVEIVKNYVTDVYKGIRDREGDKFIEQSELSKIFLLVIE